MKNYFQKWYENLDIPASAKDLFDESVDCFRIDAFRSSYLMAFIGMHYIIRNNILSTTNNPDNISQKKWSEICSRLKDEDSYDCEIRNIIRMKDDSRLLNINESFRKEYITLREYRNNCAHGKKPLLVFEFMNVYIVF